MRKPSTILALVLLALGGASQLGCRACQNCYDYASPVSGASCGACNGCRAGTCLSGEPTPVVHSVASEAGPVVR